MRRAGKKLIAIGGGWGWVRLVYDEYENNYVSIATLYFLNWIQFVIISILSLEKW